MPAARLGALLCRVHEDLAGFLDAVERWAGRHAPPLAAAVAARLGEDLAITGPPPG